MMEIVFVEVHLQRNCIVYRRVGRGSRDFVLLVITMAVHVVHGER